MKKIRITTSMGVMVAQLDDVRAPKTVANFLSYVASGFYEGTIFHRVIKGFMIQGGGFTSDMKQKPTNQPINNEAANGLKNEKYTIAMARTNAPHSATSQFFINSTDNDFLNFKAASGPGWGYCVFGRVIEGTNIVDEIGRVRTTRNGFHDDVPVDTIKIEKIEVVEE